MVEVKRSPFLIVFDLASNPFIGSIGALEDDVSNGSRARMFVRGGIDILTSQFGMKDPISIHPALGNVIDDIKDNSSIRASGQFVAADIWEEVGLDDAQEKLPFMMRAYRIGSPMRSRHYVADEFHSVL